MGSGKTTIGIRLAQELNLQFIDLDHFLENRYRKTIGQIFAEKGETVFREMERRVLEEVIGFENIVISTGGGVPCFFDNMQLMNRMGTTVYLKVSVDELAKRLELCKSTRPLIKDKNLEELRLFIAENLEKRSAFYEQAIISFDAENLLDQTDVDNIVCNLIKYLPQKAQL